MATQKCLMLVTADWGRRRFRKACRRFQSQGEVRVVAFSAEAQQLVRAAGMPFSQVVDYADDPTEFDLARAAIRELNDYPTRPAGERPLGEWLDYRGIPLWSFVSPNLFADVNILLKSIAILEKILDRERPDVAVGLDAEALRPWFHYLRGISKEGVVIDRLAPQVCQRRGVRWQPVAPGLVRRWRHGLSNRVGRAVMALRAGVWIMLSAGLLRRLLTAAANVLVGRRRRADARPRVLFFSHRKYWRVEYNPMRNQMARTDTAIYPVMHRLLQSNAYQARAIDGNYGFLGGLSGLVQKLFRERDVWWGTFDTWYPVAGVWRCLAGVRNCRGLLRNPESLEEVFSYRDYRMGSFFLPRLEFLLRDYLWKSAIWLEAGRKMVRQEKPALLALTYETGTLSRAIINACREAEVPTIGMQHGAFSESTDDYVRTADTHLRRFTPHKTAVWGERFRRVMVENSAFRDDEVVVAGNPRMDFLARAQSLLDKQVVYDKYGLDPRHKIVLAAPTETIGRTRHLAKDRFFEGIIRAKGALAQHQWIVKLKPGADSEKSYRELMKEHGESELILTENDLYGLLVAADVVVTPPSSIAIEALIVGKPVVYVVFPDAEDYFPHLIEQRAVLPVHDAESLPRAIESLLGPDGSAGLTTEELQPLVAAENFQPDGDASQRVVGIMEDLMAGSEVRPGPC